jgi:hypothetical protein
MKYKVELSIMFAVLLTLSMAGIASANSVTKTLYVDGVKVGSATAAQSLIYPYPRLTIGAEGSRYYPYNGLVGEMDEFAVFGRILTDANVAALYSAGSSGYVAAVNAASPLLYLRFEDASSANGSKLANSGTLADVNSTYIGAVGQDASGFVGKAAILNGANSGTVDCIDVCDWDGRLSLSDVSVAFWVKTTQSSDYPRLFQHNGGSTEQRSFGAMYNAGTNSVGLIGGGTTNYINATLNNGAWHHIVVTYESLIPASYQQEVMADDPCVYLRFDNPLPVDSSENHYWAGLTVNAIIKPTKGAMGGEALYLNNTNKGSSTGRAYIWNSYGGSNYRGSPNYTNKWGPQYSFVIGPDGVNPGDQSFEFWYKSDPTLTPDTYGCFFQQVDGMSWDTPDPSYGKEPNAPALTLTTAADGTRQLRVAGGSQWWYPGVNAPLDGGWHQIVVTYQQDWANLGYDMNVALYIDGARAAATTIVDPNMRAMLGPNLFYILQLGSEQNFGYGTNTVGGYYDEFAVYPGALSAERVGAHYAAWQPRDCAEAAARGLNVGDFNGDCKVDLDDFAILASQWHLCDKPGVAGCGPNW